jgi:hypothetical protein
MPLKVRLLRAVPAERIRRSVVVDRNIQAWRPFGRARVETGLAPARPASGALR